MKLLEHEYRVRGKSGKTRSFAPARKTRSDTPPALFSPAAKNRARLVVVRVLPGPPVARQFIHFFIFKEFYVREEIISAGDATDVPGFRSRKGPTEIEAL
jgi:hypothetical protein